MNRNTLLVLLLAVAACITWLAVRQPSARPTPATGASPVEPPRTGRQEVPDLATSDPNRDAAPGIDEVLAPTAATERTAAAPQVAPAGERRITGRVVDEEGAALPGAVVSAGGKLHATSDEAGAWTLAGFEDPPPNLLLRATAAGRVPGATVVAFIGTGDIEAPPIVLRAATTIEGRVVDHEREPVAGVRVEIEGDGVRMGMEGNVTKEDGTFRFRDVVEREWMLTVRPGDGSHPATVLAELVVQGGDRGIEVVLGEPASGTAKIVANVVDVATGEPMPVSKAVLMQGPDPDSTQAASHGEIVMKTGAVTVPDCTAGSWRLWVQAGNGMIGFAEAFIPPESTEIEVWVGIGETGNLSGRVEFEGIEARPGFVVSVLPSGASLDSGMPPWSSRGKTFAQFLVGEDGTFAFDGLLPGRMTVRVAAEGLVGEADVEVVTGRTTEVVLPVRAGARILFRIEGPPEGLRRYVAFCGSGGAGGLSCDPGAYPLDASGLLFDKTFEAGMVSWSFAFTDDHPGREGSKVCAETQRGSVSVGAGERLEVPIPFVPGVAGR